MASITGADQWTTPVLITAGQTFGLSVSGTFTGKVSVLRSKDKLNWFIVDEFTQAVEARGECGSWHWIKAGVKAGETFSGTAVVNVYS